MNDALCDDEIKSHLFYNQVRVNVAVAIVLLRKCQEDRVNKDVLLEDVRSDFVKYWSEKQTLCDDFDKCTVSNLQEKCIKDFVKILPGVSGVIKGVKGSELVNLVRKSVDVPEAVSQIDSDVEDYEEATQNCDFLRLVVALKSMVDSNKSICFDRANFRANTVSDQDDSGVDCGRSFNSSNCFSTSFVSVPSVKFKSMTHSSYTNITLKVTLQKLLRFVKGVVLKSAEDTVYNWKDSPADMTINTIKILVKEEMYIDIISDFVSKIFMNMWNSQKTTEINVIPYQIFILSRLLCHLNICTRLVEDLMQFLPNWCTSIEGLKCDTDSETCHIFISKGPLILDLISLVLKKWFHHLISINTLKNDSNTVTVRNNVKDLWKSKWENNTIITEESSNYKKYIEYVEAVRKRLIKFHRRITVEFPLLMPQIYYIIEMLNKYRDILINLKQS